MAGSKLPINMQYPLIHRLLAGISLLTFVVIIIAGVAAQARFFTITVRAAVAVLVIGLISRVVLRVIASYEEMNSGET